MSIFVLFLICAIIVITQSTIICTSGDCNIDCNLDDCDTIICTDTASSCNIKCSDENCKQSKFYLSASNSNMVHCTDTNSCHQITIECGISDQQPPTTLPLHYKYEDFDGDIDECIIILPNNRHSNLSKIQCNHNVEICQWTDDITNIDETIDFQCLGSECSTGLLCLPTTTYLSCFGSIFIVKYIPPVYTNLIFICLNHECFSAQNRSINPTISPTEQSYDQGPKLNTCLCLY